LNNFLLTNIPCLSEISGDWKNIEMYVKNQKKKGGEQGWSHYQWSCVQIRICNQTHIPIKCSDIVTLFICFTPNMLQHQYIRRAIQQSRFASPFCYCPNTSCWIPRPIVEKIERWKRKFIRSHLYGPYFWNSLLSMTLLFMI